MRYITNENVREEHYVIKLLNYVEEECKNVTLERMERNKFSFNFILVVYR